MADKNAKSAVLKVPADDPRMKALNTAVAQIEKAYGKGSIMRLGSERSLDIPGISTTSLALDLALSPESSREVREHMRRDPRKQPYLRHRIAGGVDPEDETFEVFSKTGTWGPIFADAGILRRTTDGHQIVVVAFLEATPGNAAYRGSFIANVTRRAVDEVFGATKPSEAEGR